jgi:DNA-binding MarR family transcriptional regulator
MATSEPPLVGALLRIPLDRVYEQILGALRWPGPNGQRPVELAQQAGMTRQAMNYLLGQLEDLGYVERRVDPDDVRSRRVYLTPRGTSTIGVIRGAVTELERDWAERLGPDDWGELKRLLAALNDAAAAEPAS